MRVACRLFWYCMKMNHCIYYVRSGPNEELKYSLRSLAVNGPGDIRVTIVGNPPSWLNREKVSVLDGNPYDDPYKNALYALRLMCELEPGDFWTFNDDFMVLEAWPDPFPVWYWRTIDQHMRLAMRSLDPKVVRRKKLFQATFDYLESRGIEDPNHYELHIPMKINGSEMLRLLDESSDFFTPDTPPVWRTLYGNLSTLPSEPHVQREDVKHHGTFRMPEKLDFLSTDENSFHRVQHLVSSVFIEKSPWEV